MIKNKICRNRPCAPQTIADILTSKNGSPRGEQLIDKYVRLNGSIRAANLRVIDEDGKQLGVFSREEALRLASQQELDLVEISPNADPPVAKIVDWGKYNYQRTKLQQKQRKNTKVLDLKQIRFGLKISSHDLGVKLKKANDFLEAGHKVKFTLFYRGRELAHKDLGFKLAEKVIEDYADSVIVDQPPQLAGKQLVFVLRSNGRAKAKDPQRDKETSQDNQERQGAAKASND